MNENEARLVYKNKITKKINLALFIALCVLVYLTTLLSAFLLIAEGEKDLAPRVVSWLFFGFSVLGIIFTAVLIGLMFVHSKNGLTITRFKAIDIVKQMVRGTMIIGHLALCIGAFFLGSVSVNSGFNGFLRFYTIFIIVLEIIFFVYGIWKMAWTKENPERVYGKFQLSEPSLPKSPRKTVIKSSSPKKIEASPKAIEALDVEIKEIEVKK